MKMPTAMKGWGTVVLAAAIVAGIVGVRATRSGMMSMGGAQAAGNAPTTMPGTAATYRYLSAQHSNECGLTPQGVMQMAPGGRLQGSCCSSMDMASYEEQVRTLASFSTPPQIPPDPYDISIALARELLASRSAIHLSASQQASYDQAMRLTPDQAPCCCHCWRWDMTEGLANYLIARLGWSPERVAAVVALVNGCGGTWQPVSTEQGSTP